MPLASLVAALLLLLRLTHMFRNQMKTRGVNVLDNFYDRIDMLIWPRVKAVVDNNVRSVRACVSSPKKLGPVDLHAHIVSRRYAEFTASVLTLLKGMDGADGVGEEQGEAGGRFGGKEMLRKDLSTLQSLMSQLLMSIANQHSTNKSKVSYTPKSFAFMYVTVALLTLSRRSSSSSTTTTASARCWPRGRSTGRR